MKFSNAPKLRKEVLAFSLWPPKLRYRWPRCISQGYSDDNTRFLPIFLVSAVLGVSLLLSCSTSHKNCFQLMDLGCLKTWTTRSQESGKWRFLSAFEGNFSQEIVPLGLGLVPVRTGGETCMKCNLRPCCYLSSAPSRLLGQREPKGRIFCTVPLKFIFLGSGPLFWAKIFQGEAG